MVEDLSLEKLSRALDGTITMPESYLSLTLLNYSEKDYWPYVP
jgi:hypothetical protein